MNDFYLSLIFSFYQKKKKNCYLFCHVSGPIHMEPIIQQFLTKDLFVWMQDFYYPTQNDPAKTQFCV